MGRTGVLLVGFGGPDSLDAVEPFMRNLMGRDPSPELIERVKARYLAIGGKSPLLDIAVEIAERLSAGLGEQTPVAIGMAYWYPYIDGGVERLVEQGCTRIVMVSLSPFESLVAQQKYRDLVADSVARRGGVEVAEAPLVSELDEFADYYASAAAAALSAIEPNEGAILALTAHSLPVADLGDDDPYVNGLRRVADSIAARLGLEPGSLEAGHPMFERFRTFGSSAPPRAWYLVFQSKGNKPGEWLGPDLDDLIDACAESKVPAIVAVPLGFMTDHMETLYDLDIVAADRALSQDIEFVRAPAPNDHEVVVDAIARAVTALLD